MLPGIFGKLFSSFMKFGNQQNRLPEMQEGRKIRLNISIKNFDLKFMIYVVAKASFSRE